MFDEIKNIHNTDNDIRKFGLVVGSIFVLISAVLFFKFKHINLIYIISGFMFIIFGIFIPYVARPVYMIWMIFALIIGRITTVLVLIFLFYAVITPVAFIARLFGKRFLITKKDNACSSYWHYREISDIGILDYERQF